jgi:hypothetical protein
MTKKYMPLRKLVLMWFIGNDFFHNYYFIEMNSPTSNLKLASGICPLDKLLKAGVNVALGTDSVSSNNSLSKLFPLKYCSNIPDMFEQMKLAAILSKVTSMDPTVVPASKVLQMATINGARALGISVTHPFHISYNLTFSISKGPNRISRKRQIRRFHRSGFQRPRISPRLQRDLALGLLVQSRKRVRRVGGRPQDPKAPQSRDIGRAEHSQQISRLGGANFPIDSPGTRCATIKTADPPSPFAVRALVACAAHLQRAILSFAFFFDKRVQSIQSS